jgi:hypothetical protein
VIIFAAGELLGHRQATFSTPTSSFSKAILHASMTSTTGRAADFIRCEADLLSGVQGQGKVWSNEIATSGRTSDAGLSSFFIFMQLRWAQPFADRRFRFLGRWSAPSEPIDDPDTDY